MGEVVNLRRARKQRTRVAAADDAAVRRVQSGRARAEREATERARALNEKRLDAHRREMVGDHAE